MFRSHILATLVVLAGCSTLDPLTKNPFVDEIGHDTAEDTGGDTADTATEDTATDTAAEELCQFPVPTPNGVVMMENELEIKINEQSPSVLWPHIGTFVELDFTAVHAECPAISITDMPFIFSGSDAGRTVWYAKIPETGIYVVDRSTGVGIATTLDGEFYPQYYENTFSWYGEFGTTFSVSGGNTRTVAIGYGAFDPSATPGDYASFMIEQNSIRWTDGYTEVTLSHGLIATGQMGVIADPN